jgi:hypothetical protein
MVGRNIVTQPPVTIAVIVGRRIVALVKRYLGQDIPENLVNCVSRERRGVGHCNQPM